MLTFNHNKFLSTDTIENALSSKGYIDDQGDKNITKTLTTSQTEFDDNQDLITKKYVDDSNRIDSVKTQNITAVANHTTVTGVLTIESLQPILNIPLMNTPSNQLVQANVGSYGMRFTISSSISIFRLGIPSIHWTEINPNSSIGIQFYKEGDPSFFLGASVRQSTMYGDYYVINLPKAYYKVLQPGTYRMACFYPNNMNTMNLYASSMAPMQFASPISNVEACSSPEYGVYPINITPGLEMTYAGFFWYDIIPLKGTIDMTNNDIINCTNIDALTNKSQNINNTIENITNVKGIVNIGTAISSREYPLTSSSITEFISSNNSSFGFKFTLTSAIALIRVGIPVLSWTNASITSSVINIYVVGNSTAIYSCTLSRNSQYNGFYVLDLTASPVNIPIGTYYFSIGLNIGQSYYNSISKPFAFDSSFITNVRACSSTTINGGYPDSFGDDNFLSSGYFWFTTSDNILIAPKIETNIIQSNSSNVLLKNTIDMNYNNILNCNKLNGLTSTGGVWMAISSGLAITNTNTERSLLTGATTLGSLIFPPGTFTISGYHLNIAGNFSSQSNNLIIRLKSNSTILSEFPLILTVSTGEYFDIECDLTIRSIGAIGVAVIVCNWRFTYSGIDTMTFRGDRMININSTLFSTSVSNTLDITAQFSTTTLNNSMQMLHGVLSKTY